LHVGARETVMGPGENHTEAMQQRKTNLVNAGKIRREKKNVIPKDCRVYAYSAIEKHATRMMRLKEK